MQRPWVAAVQPPACQQHCVPLLLRPGLALHLGLKSLLKISCLHFQFAKFMFVFEYNHALRVYIANISFFQNKILILNFFNVQHRQLIGIKIYKPQVVSKLICSGFSAKIAKAQNALCNLNKIGYKIQKSTLTCLSTV